MIRMTKSLNNSGKRKFKNLKRKDNREQTLIGRNLLMRNQWQKMHQFTSKPNLCSIHSQQYQRTQLHQSILRIRNIYKSRNSQVPMLQYTKNDRIEWRKTKTQKPNRITRSPLTRVSTNQHVLHKPKRLSGHSPKIRMQEEN